MTALTSPILFNASTGSDTAASGSGSVDLSGTGASTNNTTAVDVSADGVDTSGITAGDLLWVDSSSGRQFSVIASVDSGTDIITCDDTFTQTESSRNWGIGDKRATIDNTNSRKLLTADALPGWILRFENAGGTQTFTSAITLGVSGDTTDGPIIIEGDSSSTYSLFNSTANDNILESGSQNYVTLRNLKFTNSQTVSKTASRGLYFTGSSYWVIDGCKFGDATNQLLTGVARASGSVVLPLFIHTVFTECTSHGNSGPNSNQNWKFIQCTFSNNSGDGFNGNVGVVLFDRCLVFGNTGDGIKVPRNGATVVVMDCVIHSNADGIDASNTNSIIVATRNIITENGSVGIRSVSDSNQQYADYNAFFSNTSGNHSNISSGSNDVLLSGDPFVDAAGEDFNIDVGSVGGGELVAATKIMPS